MWSLEWVNIRTNVRTYVLTYIRTGQTLYPLHNFVVRGDNKPYWLKENVCQMQLCYESNGTIEFSVPVEYAKCQMLRWLEII